MRELNEKRRALRWDRPPPMRPSRPIWLSRSRTSTCSRVRTTRCVVAIPTVGELVAHFEADLLDIRNFGTKSIEEIKESLAALGMTLKDSMPSFAIRSPPRSFRTTSPSDPVRPMDALNP